MPGDRRYEDEVAARRERFGYTQQREADRRVAIRQRAGDLKRALMQSTMLITGRQRVVGNKAVYDTRRGSSFLRFCAVLLAGASSMLIPIPSSISLHGQLLAAVPDDSGMPAPQLPRAVVAAQPAQCAQLGYDEPAMATIEAPSQEGNLFEAHITRLAPNTAAPGAQPACQIELELRAPKDAPELANALPPGAAVYIQLPAQPRNWLTALVERTAGDGKARALRTQLASAYSYAGARLKHFTQNTELGQNLKASIKDILKPEDAEE